MNQKELKIFLNSKVDFYNQPSFIPHDPISIPHRFTALPDIEIAGFFAAIFAWGNRTTIIKKCTELLQLMDNAPHDFILHYQPRDLKKLEAFKHRTFNATDLLYCIEFFHRHYSNHSSLETAFTKKWQRNDETIENGLNGFYHYFFSLSDIPERTKKHIAAPEKKSSCKRLNMFLRWMVRKDKKGVDFGAWKNIKPAQLVMPIDVHVARVARRLGIIQHDKTDWATALELTAYLRHLDAADPVKYDFALFSLGAFEKML
ncbi:MAG: TIGR02757 family protein [Bacteroidetes bacterium]|nr:TIGR02757 family protein [Bacteroidota bacterium]